MGNLITLFLEFLKIGTFTVGGGLATLPFLFELADKYQWFSYEELMNMVAISESTPGPIGINMATYVGYNVANIIGAIAASIATIIPALFFIVLIAKFLGKFKDNKYVQAIFYGLRPAVAALVLNSGFQILLSSLFNIKSMLFHINISAIIFFLITFVLIRKYKKQPIIYILLGAFVGLVIPF